MCCRTAITAFVCGVAAVSLVIVFCRAALPAGGGGVGVGAPARAGRVIGGAAGLSIRRPSEYESQLDGISEHSSEASDDTPLCSPREGEGRSFSASVPTTT